MKTQFDQLIKAQEQKLAMCEQHIARCRNEVATKQDRVNGLIEKIATMNMPQSGDFSVFIQANARKRALIFEIDSMQEQIALHKARIQELEQEYRQLCIECEKIKHIRDKEREKIITAFKQKERKELDEIATLLYNKEIV